MVSHTAPEPASVGAVHARHEGQRPRGGGRQLLGCGAAVSPLRDGGAGSPAERFEPDAEQAQRGSRVRGAQQAGRAGRQADQGDRRERLPRRGDDHDRRTGEINMNMFRCVFLFRFHILELLLH